MDQLLISIFVFLFSRQPSPLITLFTHNPQAIHFDLIELHLLLPEHLFKLAVLPINRSHKVFRLRFGRVRYAEILI